MNYVWYVLKHAIAFGVLSAVFGTFWALLHVFYVWVYGGSL